MRLGSISESLTQDTKVDVGLKPRASFPLNGACGVEVLLGRVVSDVPLDSHDFARGEREHGEASTALRPERARPTRGEKTRKTRSQASGVKEKISLTSSSLWAENSRAFFPAHEGILKSLWLTQQPA